MTDLSSLESDAADLVAKARAAGADECDVVVSSGQSRSVNVRDGAIENSKHSEQDSISLRVICGKKVASVTSNARTDFTKLAERAVAMAKVSPDDPFQSLADPERLYDTSKLEQQIGALDLLDEKLPETSELESMARSCEAAGLAVGGVTKSMGGSANWSRSGFVLATSQGFSGSYERSGFSLSAAMVAGEGTAMERDYEFDSAIHQSDLKDPQEVGRQAGERVVKRLGPRKVKSGSFPIIFDKRVSSGVLGSLASAINAASVARKTSFFRDQMGKHVCGENISIVDDPHMVRRGGSRPFDGEGVKTGAIRLIDKGILQEWILDTASATELGLETNGRAGRGGSGTHPSTTNCYMENGLQSTTDLIRTVKQGLYLNETIGHGINMVTGDFSKGASGFWIENGEIAYPVAEITVAGNLKDMFMHMTPADDLEFRYGTDAPTLLIEGMTIGGS